ncbi:hypothetical protein [Burkholderia sp. Ac-20353]|uniref:hypothetical protein n=1 Tax=Burkholderia sp. Ac-20353 TaxID=2703894 RepID=UPI00197B07E4|nr:hypothetical protein [Burkholderia sp. Ac-20353]MBN3787650.1 hypothetical protein [Burkholderia sp. Ac-20353]
MKKHRIACLLVAMLSLPAIAPAGANVTLTGKSEDGAPKPLVVGQSTGFQNPEPVGATRRFGRV